MNEETEIWIECDVCGWAFGGDRVFEMVQSVACGEGRMLVCNECLARRERVSSAGRGCGATEAARESRSGAIQKRRDRARMLPLCVSLRQPTPPSTAKSFGAHGADAARKDLD